MKILDVTYDYVINSHILVCKSTIKESKEKLLPLINKYDEQRYTLNSKLYNRLREDIEKGCIIPPLTIALIGDVELFSSFSSEEQEKYINDNIDNAFVLDGIQRLNNIGRIDDLSQILDNTIYINVIIAKSSDKLLYRMITLNNGQKPMSARHQIEILCNNLFDFSTIPFEVQSEKNQKTSKKNNDALTKENIVKAYLAFITNSINIDNQRIIDEKMDELIGEKIMDSNINNRKNDFNSFIKLISRLMEDDYLLKWLSNLNNMIGFASSGDKVFEIDNYEMDLISSTIKKVDNIFTSSINTSKIKVSTYRRKIARFIGNNFVRVLDLSSDDILDLISNLD